MIQIQLDSETLLSGLTKQHISNIKSLVTINNPMFYKRLDIGLSNWGVPPDLSYYTEMGDSSIIVPMGATEEVINLLLDSGQKLSKRSITDNRVDNELVDYFSKLKFNGEPRKYQGDTVDVCMDKTVGVVQAKTGSGKTFMFVDLTFRRQQQTLILVNTIELADQTVDAFCKFSNIKKEDIGFIGNGKFDLKPITVCLHQTLAKLNGEKTKLVSDKVGMVIADEVHICAADSYYNNMCKLRAKYKFGFSATPKRPDGLTKVIHWATGPTIHEVDPALLKDVLITPDPIYINTNYYFPYMGSHEYQEMITDLCDDEERNQLIVRTLNRDYKYNNVAMLCSRVSQVETLKEMIGRKAVMLHSKMTKKVRKTTMDLLRNRKKTVVISTYGLFSTGIDIPHLDTLFLCAPMRSEIKIRQSAGRLMRMCEGKTAATIVDFVDKKIDPLKYQAYARKKILTTL
jgi:superfamily II DNA or RNA helicase